MLSGFQGFRALGFQRFSVSRVFRILGVWGFRFVGFSD